MDANKVAWLFLMPILTGTAAIMLVLAFLQDDTDGIVGFTLGALAAGVGLSVIVVGVGRHAREMRELGADYGLFGYRNRGRGGWVR